MRSRFFTAFAAVILGLAAIGACSSADPLPPIADPQQLLRDIAPLLDGQHNGAVPASDWPASLAALHPRQVLIERDAVIVTCELSTGVGARGYVLDPRNLPIDPRLNPRSTVDAGIYKYEWRP